MLNDYYIVSIDRTDLLNSSDNAMQQPIYSNDRLFVVLKTKVGINDSVDFLGLEKLTLEQLNVELQKSNWIKIENEQEIL